MNRTSNNLKINPSSHHIIMKIVDFYISLHIWTMHPCCGIISLSVFILPILKLWTLQKNIKKKIRMYPTTVGCLRNANSTKSRMAAWCHALSLAVQRLPAMNTVSFFIQATPALTGQAQNPRAKTIRVSSIGSIQ